MAKRINNTIRDAVNHYNNIGEPVYRIAQLVGITESQVVKILYPNR